MNQRILGHDDPPRLGAAAAAAQPGHQRQPSGGEPRRERVQRADSIGVRRRMSNGIDFTASYTLASAQEHDRQRRRRAQHREHPGSEQSVRRAGADRAGNRHRRAAPRHRSPRRSSCRGASTSRRSIYYRSALPVALVDGRDLNLDGDATEIPAKAFAVDTFDPRTPAVSTFKEIGNCETVNCGRGMAQHAVEPAGVEGVQPRRPRARRSDRRGVQPVQRGQPERLPRRA